MLKKFVGDAQSKALIVQQYKKLEEDDDENADAPSEAECRRQYQIRLDEQVVEQGVTSITFIKKSSVIEEEKAVSTQLRVINFENASPFETLHSYVSNAVAPYFKSYVNKSGKARYLLLLGLCFLLPK